MNHAFRFTLLVGICIVLIYLLDIPNKFPLMIGAIIGVLLGYIVGFYIHKRIKKKNNLDKEE